jgi:hypothetical protein
VSSPPLRSPLSRVGRASGAEPDARAFGLARVPRTFASSPAWAGAPRRSSVCARARGAATRTNVPTFVVRLVAVSDFGERRPEGIPRRREAARVAVSERRLCVSTGDSSAADVPRPVPVSRQGSRRSRIPHY